MVRLCGVVIRLALGCDILLIRVVVLLVGLYRG